MTTASPIDGALGRRMVFWIALVVSTTAVMGSPATTRPLVTVGSINIFWTDVLLAAALVLGPGYLMRAAGNRKPTLGRFTSRTVTAYLLYQVLAVIPVALWIGEAPLQSIVRVAALRLDWLYFPVLVPLFRDSGMRKKASYVALMAAAALAVWGVYLAVIGGGGFYLVEGGALRYRVLGPVAVPLFFWPSAVAVSGAVKTRGTLILAALTLLGLTLCGFRSGYLAVAVALMVGLITSKRLSRAAAWALPLGLIAVVAYGVLGAKIDAIYGFVFGHLIDVRSATAQDRLGRWGLAMDFIRSHPFNDYLWTWRAFLVNVRKGYQPHDFVLEIAQIEGIPGLVFYGVMLTATLRAAWKRVWDDVELRALICFLIAYLVFSAFNANWYAYGANLPLLVAAVAGIVARVDQLNAASEGRSGNPPTF